MWYFKKQAILLMAVLFVCVLEACSEFILEPRITFEISVDQKRFEEENYIDLTLHSFNLGISSLEITTLKVDEEDVSDFTVSKEEKFNQILIEFPLSDSITRPTQILVGVDKPFYRAGFAMYELF